MLALSPSLFPTTYAYPLQNSQKNCTDISSEFEARAYYSFIDSHSYNQIHHDLIPQNSISISSQGDVNDSMNVFKKLNHNASERDRRKKVNQLYSFLRSLLPVSTHQKKKLSIPLTISRAVKFIPELQKEVEALTRKKEKISSYSSLNLNTSKREPFIDSSVRVLGEKEVVIQLVISSTENRHQNKDIGLLSKVVEYFEHKEEGFVLLNSTTFVGSREEMSLNTLHLQAQDDKIIEAKRLKEKLWSFQVVADIEIQF